jgi:hypothetical protein
MRQWGLLPSALRPERLPIAPGGRRLARSSSKPARENSWTFYTYGTHKAIFYGLSLLGNANAWQSPGALQLCVILTLDGFNQVQRIPTRSSPDRHGGATIPFSPGFNLRVCLAEREVARVLLAVARRTWEDILGICSAIIFRTSNRHGFAARHVLFSPLAWPTGFHTRYRNRLASIDDGTWILNNNAS